MATPASILISYRRDDSSPWAGRLYDQLAINYGRKNVFMDIDSIGPGLDFKKLLQDRISRCNVCLAIIGSRWIDSKSNGRRRLEDPSDFVRLEIEAALKQGAQIIPILVDGAKMPSTEHLPDTLKPLASMEAVAFTHETFRSNLNDLNLRIRKHREGDLSRSGTNLLMASAFAVLPAVLVERLGSEVASKFFDFSQGGMDFAEGILGSVIVFAITFCIGCALVYFRGNNLTDQERTLYWIGFILLGAAILPDIFRVFLYAFTGYGLIHPSVLIGYSIAYLVSFIAIYMIFSKRGPELSHLEWLIGCTAIFVWLYAISETIWVVLDANFFHGTAWREHLDRATFLVAFQVGFCACGSALIALLALVARRRTQIAA
jgi:TIR domain